MSWRELKWISWLMSIWLFRTVAAEILSSVYGYTVKDTKDTLVQDSATLVENFTIAAIPASKLDILFICSDEVN